MIEPENNIHMAIQVIPLLKDKKELYQVIDDVISLIEKSGLKHHISAMETSIEGTFTKLIGLLQEIYHLTGKNSDEFLINIKIHSRNNQSITFLEKGLPDH